MITKIEHRRILEEYNALISYASGKYQGISILHDPSLARNLEWLRDSYVELYEKCRKLSKKKKKQMRKTGEHLFVPCGGLPRCATCGCDEDDAFVGGEKCSYDRRNK